MRQIYQLKIELRDSHPKIWRRVQVTEEITFSELHYILQLAMGWENDHMYEFVVKKIRIHDFGDVLDDGSNLFERDSQDTCLNELINKVKSKFTYIYDFGDDWEHIVVLEKILPEEEDKTYPAFIDGERACPPEDCGGIWRYQGMLTILTNKNHPEYDEVSEWMGDDWDAEFFDPEVAEVALQNYAEQWEEEADLYDEGGPIEFDELDKFSSPEDVLRDEYHRKDMEERVEMTLEEPGSKEHEAFERLRNLGFDKEKSEELILQALSIEWFYDLKYWTDHLEDRYAYNLHHLPETSLEFPRLDDALAVLDSCKNGIPFSAIEYVHNDPSDAATSSILKALRNHWDHQYCWADCMITPFWYALAAEGHLCEQLIDPVIQLYEDNPNDSGWLREQGQYLIGKLAQKHPDLTAEKVLEAMESHAEKNSKPDIYFLFDAFYFCDIDKFKPRLLSLLERDELSWYDMLTATIADLKITEGLPILKRKLEKFRTDSDENNTWSHSAIEIEEAIRILEGEIILDVDRIKPLCLKREASWKDHLKENEHLFYEDNDFSSDFYYPDSLDQNLIEPIRWPLFSDRQPYIKEKTVGRNDPCPCGSGKKYKKCCLD